MGKTAFITALGAIPVPVAGVAPFAPVTVGGKQGVFVPVMVPGQPPQARFVPFVERSESFFRPQKGRDVPVSFGKGQKALPDKGALLDKVAEPTRSLFRPETPTHRAALGGAGAGLLGASLLGLGPIGALGAGAAVGVAMLLRRRG